MLDLAEQREFPEAAGGSPKRAASPRRTRPKLKVAVAYDEVFSGYFPDTLDALEQRGVTVCDFSTLRDESLPVDCDLVYIGCGRMQRHATELSGNHCLLSALREHVCSGRRIYAEGSGLAYLCQALVFPDGRRVPMVGVLPAEAHLSPQPCSPRPIELTLAGGTWLGPAGVRLRGYVERSLAAGADRPAGQLRRRARAEVRSSGPASSDRQPGAFESGGAAGAIGKLLAALPGSA